MTVLRTDDLVYALVRSRRTTADIVIERDGRLIVRAPEHVSEPKVVALVRAKRRWIYKNLAEWRDLNATRVLREFRNGEGFLYLGRSYRLRLVERQEVALRLRDGLFCLQRSLVEEGGVAAARNAFRDYFVARGRERIAQRVDYFAPKVGVQPKAVAVKELGHRWASCTPGGRLAFHWKCMMAPLTVLDYIVVHELCHFHYLNHTDSFWNEVDKVIPNYRERKEWLAKHGAALDV